MIVGMHIDGIHAERSEIPVGDVMVNFSTHVRDVQEIPESKDELTKIFFEFGINYTQNEKKIGSIALKGHVVWKGMQKSLKDSWKNSKTLAEGISTPVMSNVVRKCLVKSVGLAEDIMLPTPVPLPTVKVEEKTQPDKKKK